MLSNTSAVQTFTEIGVCDTDSYFQQHYQYTVYLWSGLSRVEVGGVRQMAASGVGLCDISGICKGIGCLNVTGHVAFSKLYALMTLRRHYK